MTGPARITSGAMETARITSTNESLSGSPLSENHETFAQAFVELNNASAAYRRVYDVDKRQPAQQIWTNAARLVAHPDVAIRIRQLRDVAAAGAVMRAIDLMRDDADIASADPNEVVSVVIESCRNCHGVDHAHQWIDEAEYARAYAVFMEHHAKWDKLPAKVREVTTEPVPPGMDGGFGFDAKVAPAIDCPHCFGKGVQDVTLHDTTKLSPAARKLYKGAKKDRYGAIEVFMHDQAAARDRLYRVLGAYKDGAAVPSVALPEQKDPISATASDEDAARRYLAMVGR